VLSRDEKSLLLADSYSKARIIDLANLNSARSFDGGSTDLRAVALSPRTNIVVSADLPRQLWYPTVHAWRTDGDTNPVVLREVPENQNSFWNSPVSSLQFSVDGQWLLAVGPERSVVTRLSDDLVFSDLKKLDAAHAGAISADGKLIALSFFESFYVIEREGGASRFFS
jgi:WD40 repeat protein